MRRRGAIFLRINTDPPMRLTSIVGKIDLPQDVVESDPVAANRVYVGFGLTGIPVVQQLINGLADRVDFQLSGVPKESAQTAELEAGDVKGKAAYLGIVPLGEDWQPTGAVRWLWNGFADVVTVSRTTDTSGAIMRTLGLSVGTLNALRKRAKFEMYSPVSQRAKSPTDAICDLTPRYTAGATKKWA